MAKAIDILLDQEFQAEQDNDEVKTTWILRTLSGLEFLSCTTGGYVDHDRFITLGLTGWKDFFSSDGEQIEFSKKDIARIPAPILQEISYKVQEISSLSEDERKNS